MSESEHGYQAQRAREGVLPSRLQLPEGPWSTVLEAVSACLLRVSSAQWRERFEQGRVLDAQGRPVAADLPYRLGMELRYFRDVEHEAEPSVAERILFESPDLMVVDKPHGMAVTPAGQHLKQTLMARLIRRTGNAAMVAVHRLDRDTAGLVMFSRRPETRAQYHALFHRCEVDKLYEAIAPPLPALEFPLLRRSRIGVGEPFYRRCEVEGAANSETRIDVIEKGGDDWRYALRPVTGRQHQLRVHMAALGAPIRNDPLYPDLIDPDMRGPEPLQLLARRLAFRDPLDGRERVFESTFALDMPSAV